MTTPIGPASPIEAARQAAYDEFYLPLGKAIYAEEVWLRIGCQSVAAYLKAKRDEVTAQPGWRRATVEVIDLLLAELGSDESLRP